MAKLKIGNMDLSISPQQSTEETPQIIETSKKPSETPAIDMTIYQEKILEVATAVSKLNESVSKMNASHDDRLASLSNTTQIMSTKIEELERKKSTETVTIKEVSVGSSVDHSEELFSLDCKTSKLQDSVVSAHNYANSNHLELVDLNERQIKINKILIIGLVITTLLHLI